MLLYCSNAWLRLAEAMLIIVAPLVCLVLLFDSCESCLRKVSNIADIHKCTLQIFVRLYIQFIILKAGLQQSSPISYTRRSDSSKMLVTEKRLFSLQLLQLQPTFTGAQFFHLNYAAMGSVCGVQ